MIIYIVRVVRHSLYFFELSSSVIKSKKEKREDGRKGKAFKRVKSYER